MDLLLLFFLSSCTYIYNMYIIYKMKNYTVLMFKSFSFSLSKCVFYLLYIYIIFFASHSKPARVVSQSHDALIHFL